MSARTIDTNGWFEVKNNPLSRVGVFPYSGAQISKDLPPGEIFSVFRPPEELSAPEAMRSFHLQPLVDDHAMLGEGFKPAEDHGVHGVIGQDVNFQDDTLYGTVKVFSKTLADKIKKGKTELSLGYRCRYERAPGVYNGQAYDYVQRGLRGNHVALVDQGRMGPDISVLDHLVFTVDAKEPRTMTPEQIAKLKEALAACMAALTDAEAAPAEAVPVVAKVADETPPAPVPAPAKDEPAPAPVPSEEKVTVSDEDKPATMDAALKTIADLQKTVATLSARPAMDETAMVTGLAARNTLADRLSKHVGTFAHDAMTLAQVAAYGVEKLGIKCAKGSEVVALDTALQVMPVPVPVKTGTGMDAAPLAARIAAHAHATPAA